MGLEEGSCRGGLGVDGCCFTGEWVSGGCGEVLVPMGGGVGGKMG